MWRHRVRTRPAGVIQSGLADIVAGRDVDSKRLAAGRIAAAKFHREAGRAAPEIGASGDDCELPARADIDAVVLSVPDPWHAAIALAAVRAGKNAYLRKPFALTHAEGDLLRAEVAKGGRICQVGSRQRSRGPNAHFRKA
jgi:predicted dehydrogenase